MCEFASVVATIDGPLQIYASPGIKSHGDARAGWKITGGAEVEWTDEGYDSLLVRHEDNATAKTIRALLMERFPKRAAMIASITEVRGQGERSSITATESAVSANRKRDHSLKP